VGWSQVGQSQGRSGCCLESCSCPSRCPVCAPFATSFSLSVGSRSCCLPAGVFFGWHNGSAVCSTARVASAAGQATATSPANSERSSESSPKPIAQADPGSRPPSRRAAICRACVRRHRHHRRRLRDRRLRACAPPPSPRTASDTAASEPTASDPAVSEPAIPSSAAPVAFLCGRSGQSRRRRLLFRRARRLRAERAASVPASTSSAGRLAVCGRSECCHASRGRSALIFPFLV
jgi:hypothetical protein